MNKNIYFFKRYFQYFYISKFLYNTHHAIFDIKYIWYNTDINKISLTNMFWTFFILFRQVPQFLKYTKQPLEKITHGSLVISQAKNTFYLFFKKFINFFLLYAATEMFYIKKKNKTNINNLILNNNNYFSELSKLPRLVFDSFNICIHVKFNNNNKISIFEKTQVFRVLQLPISLGWNEKNFSQKKAILARNRKSNYIK